MTSHSKTNIIFVFGLCFGCSPKVEEKVEMIEPERNSFPVADSSVMKYVIFSHHRVYIINLDDILVLFCVIGTAFNFSRIWTLVVQPDDSEWDDLGGDLYEIPEVAPVQSSNVILEAPPTNIADEESKIKALIDTPALDWQRWISFSVFSWFHCVML